MNPDITLGLENHLMIGSRSKPNFKDVQEVLMSE